jgi:fructokinase
MNEKQTVEHPGFKVRVNDAVGAGDAFTAALIHHYLKGSSLEKIAQAANRFASYVASQNGAMPQIDKGILNQVM